MFTVYFYNNINIYDSIHTYTKQLTSFNAVAILQYSVRTLRKMRQMDKHFVFICFSCWQHAQQFIVYI